MGQEESGNIDFGRPKTRHPTRLFSEIRGGEGRGANCAKAAIRSLKTWKWAPPPPTHRVGLRVVIVCQTLPLLTVDFFFAEMLIF